jgi:transposase, IS5 family
MRPKERRESGQNDLFRARLGQIVDMGHSLAKLARAIDWRFLETQFGAVYSDRAGHPPFARAAGEAGEEDRRAVAPVL